MIVLATWLWQGIAIAGVTAVLLSMTRTFGAATRHAVWWTTLAAVALLPFAWLLPRVAVSGALVSAPELPLADAAVPLPATPDAALMALGTVWATVVLLSFVRIAFSVRAVRRLKRASIPVNAARAARLPMWRALAGTRRLPELRVSRDVRAASALGLGRPVILLSPAVLALDDDRLDAVVMHEHAHLARFDDWTQLVQALVSALLALHPAVWYIGRRIRLEREAACDDFVLARGAAARRYARSLVELADPTRLQLWASVAIPGAARSRSELRERVHRLLDPSRPRDARLAWPAFATCAVTMMIAVGVSARTPAFVVFVESHVPAPPVAARVRAAPFATRTVAFSAAAPQSAAPRRPVAAAANSAAPTPAATGTAQAPPQITAAPLPQVGLVATPLTPVPAAQRVVPADLGIAQYPAPPATPPAAASNAPPGYADPWVSVARTVSSARKSTASSVNSAGASIGRFFGRAGQALAGSF